MNSKFLIWLGAFVGGMIGSYIPVIFGASLFSFSSVILSTVGGIIGILIGFKMSKMI